MVAVMAAAESMYYQVPVPENQQTYLKFLSWENHDVKCQYKSLSCVHMYLVALLLKVVPIVLYIEQQWTMKLNLEWLLQVHSITTSM